jgi:hypothetical protein
MGMTKGGIMSRAHEGLPPDSPGDVRALPARPNLEFERKQAKQLLAQLRKGAPDALARIHAKHRASTGKSPDEFQLSDAQFTIAREYGFSSWPRLVEYFTALYRQERSGGRHDSSTPERHERAAERLLAQHRHRGPAAQFFATFVPRFHGRDLQEVLAAEVTIDDARLVHARMYRYPSWDALLEDAREEHQPPQNEWSRSATPDYRAGRAIRSGDIEALGRLIDENPQLMEKVRRVGHVVPINILHGALWHEVEVRTREARAVTDYIVSRGGDLRETASAMLVRPIPRRGLDAADVVEYLLGRGADPEWLPPNGVPILEHMLCSYWNGEAVDVIARRVKPRQAFWIAAGLGDVEAVRRYTQPGGSVTPAARQNRPDFTALMMAPMPFLSAADDTTIVWEAFFVAGLNQRYAVLDVLLDQGFPIDYIEWGQSLLHLAVGNRWADLVEFLVKRGADVTLRDSYSGNSARQAAEYTFANGSPDDPVNRRLFDLCGGRDPERLLREAAEARAKQTRPSPPLMEAFTLAKQDALHMGKSSAGLESLFVGLLRGSNTLAATFLNIGGVDLNRLKAILGKRLDPSDEAVEDIPLDDWASQACLDAQEEAKRRRHPQVNPLHLLFVLLRPNDGPVAEMIRAAGGELGNVQASLEKNL